jgi:membrane-bound hydrogenase subunit alpha
MAEVTIPIGPQHPALKEPSCFQITLEGERVVRADVRLGYNHRGIEKAAEERSFIQDLFLVERICGICSHSHTTCFAQAVEELAGIEVPKRGLYLRTLVCELERAHSHLLWLGVAGHEVGFDTLLMYTWRDREVVMDLLAMITGNRVNYGYNAIGGVRRDLLPEQIADIRKGVDILEERTKYYIGVASTETTLIQRLLGVGPLSHDDAVLFNTTGPTGRASNVDRDIRRDDPYAAYPDLSFNVVVDDHCDVLGRTLVRVGELLESYKMLRQILDQLPEGPIVARKVPRRIPEGEVFSRYEAPRGEDVHYVRSNGSERPERVKVRAPTMANMRATLKMIEGGFLADVPIVLAAIDPCFSCTDRAIAVLDRENRPSGSLDWDDLHRYSLDFYRSRGVDPTRLRIPALERP